MNVGDRVDLEGGYFGKIVKVHPSSNHTVEMATIEYKTGRELKYTTLTDEELKGGKYAKKAS